MTEVQGGFRVVDHGDAGIAVYGPGRMVEVHPESQHNAWRIVRPEGSDDFRQTKELAIERAKELAA